MTFTLQPGQRANLTFQSNVQGAHLQNLRFDVAPLQPLPNFPLPIYGNAFPTSFTNTGAIPDDFGIDGYQYVPPLWNPSGWQRMIPRTAQTSAPNVFIYGWGTAGQVLWQVTVTVV